MLFSFYLLSAHLMSVEHSAKLRRGYNGELLKMATELGDRMLPAFNTPTGIPYSRVIRLYLKILATYTSAG